MEFMAEKYTNLYHWTEYKALFKKIYEVSMDQNSQGSILALYVF